MPLLTDKAIPQSNSELWEDFLKDVLRVAVNGQRFHATTGGWDWLKQRTATELGGFPLISVEAIEWVARETTRHAVTGLFVTTVEDLREACEFWAQPERIMDPNHIASYFPSAFPPLYLDDPVSALNINGNDDEEAVIKEYWEAIQADTSVPRHYFRRGTPEL